jgi:septal ring-binding cell division protein DamX
MRSKIIAIGLVLGTLIAVPAFAAPAQGGSPARGQRAEKGERIAFPVPAATFKQHVDARMAKARAHMEERASKLPADQAKELRAKFEAGAAAMNAEVAKAIADGTVTKEEAQAVRAAGPRGGHGGHCDGKEKGKKA